ncbi:MAG: 30S ribosome-binding factor RbfA [Ignavibacteriae bacterium]|nr:30S ribosome-binding factor RbfA [Ignavibacteriota bacterium]
MSVRTEKVASLIKQELGVIFQRNFSMEEYGFITVTEVRVSPDLKIAKVYVSVFGDAERKQRSMDLLEQEKNFVRAELGHGIRLKFTPSLIFYLDESLDRAMNINRILDKIHKDEAEGKE